MYMDTLTSWLKELDIDFEMNCSLRKKFPIVSSFEILI